jgi:exopolyphosphatase/guanosine-5'-triphosphate,3'-diphosphate pyrophosphatase
MNHPDAPVASFDVGSNTVLMLVAHPCPRTGWRRVDDHLAITRIARGMDATGVLEADAVQRTAQALETMVEAGRAAGVTRWVATGTAPFRKARNGPDVALALGRHLPCTLDVVTGDREAALVLEATRQAFGGLQDMTVLDIGGASTEIIAVRQGRVAAQVSVDVGSVRLTERTLGSGDPPTASGRAALHQALDEALDLPDVARVFEAARGPVVGVAGTVTTLATLHLGMDTWDDARVHGADLPTAWLVEAAERLLTMPLADRLALPGMPSQRADVIPAGAALLARLATGLGADTVRVSDRGVRWGRLWDAFGDPRRS